MRKRQLTYQEAYEAANRIMDLDFCKKLKDRYDQINREVSSLGVGLDFLAPMLVLDEEEILIYVSQDDLENIKWLASMAPRQSE